MVKNRLIACLLMRHGLIVQSFGFNKYLPIGLPKYPIEFVAKWDVDEIILLDMSATQEKLGPNIAVIEMLSHSCFVPLTVGGGITSIADVRKVIRAGADKVSINVGALERPALISEIAEVFGSQCAVVSIDCRRDSDARYMVYSDSGRKKWDIEACVWALKAQEAGAGEIFLNSIDRDGSRLGYDLELIRSVTSLVSVPVIACGGVGNFSHFSPGVINAGAAAVAAANIFHHVEHSTILAKAHLHRDKVNVRLDSVARYDDREFDASGRPMMLEMTRLMEIEIKRGNHNELL